MTYKQLAVFLAYNGSQLSPNIVLGLDDLNDNVVIHTCHYSYAFPMVSIIDMQVTKGRFIMRRHNIDALVIDLHY